MFHIFGSFYQKTIKIHEKYPSFTYNYLEKLCYAMNYAKLCSISAKLATLSAGSPSKHSWLAQNERVLNKNRTSINHTLAFFVDWHRSIVEFYI